MQSVSYQASTTVLPFNLSTVATTARKMKRELLLIAVLASILIVGALAKRSGRRGPQRQGLQFDRTSRTGTSHSRTTRTGTSHSRTTRTGTSHSRTTRTRTSRTRTTGTPDDDDDRMSRLAIVGTVLNRAAAIFQFCLNDSGVTTFAFENRDSFIDCLMNPPPLEK